MQNTGTVRQLSFAIPMENTTLFIMFVCILNSIIICVMYKQYMSGRSVHSACVYARLIYVMICICTQTLYIIPLPYDKSQTLKSDILDLDNKHNIEFKSSMLHMFSVKARKGNFEGEGPAIMKQLKEKNYVYKAKHSPPANKEWLNSIYAYNNNSVKVLPSLDKTVLSFVKSYFNLYSRKLEKRVKIQHRRARSRRYSTIRMLVSKAEIKHTADKAIITIYVYNRFKKHYLDIIKEMWPLDQVDNSLFTYLKKEAIKNNVRLEAKEKKTGKKQNRVKDVMPIPKPSMAILNNVKQGALQLMFKISGHRDRYLRLLDKNKGSRGHATHATPCREYDIRDHEKKYVKRYVVKSLRKEITSTYYKQLILFHKSKFEKGYLRPFTKLVEGVYNKRVEFNFVNLKYLYHNSYIFSNAIVTKLRNRKNKILRVLSTSLQMFTLPRVNGLAVYNEIYNRKKIMQNITLHDLMRNDLNFRPESCLHASHSDKLERSLLKLDSYDFFSFLTNNVSKNYAYLTNNVFGFLKNKFISGARFEVSGRLTKRNTAARALSKLKYKGNIKNMDSSNKGLSTVMLRGHAKSNLQYSQLKSKIRIGSFGLKGWVSSN